MVPTARAVLGESAAIVTSLYVLVSPFGMLRTKLRNHFVKLFFIAYTKVQLKHKSPRAVRCSWAIDYLGAGIKSHASSYFHTSIRGRLFLYTSIRSIGTYSTLYFPPPANNALCNIFARNTK